MATVNRFEDLDVWKESKKLALSIYFHFKPLKDFGFRDQIYRASVSVMNNIAEGFERNSDKEFQRFLSISKGSLGEVRSMIILAIDLQYINQENGENLIKECLSTSGKLANFIKYLNKIT